MEESFENRPKIKTKGRRNFLKAAAISAAGAVLAACGKGPKEPEKEEMVLPPASEQVKKYSQELAANPEELSRLFAEIDAVNPEIMPRLVQLEVEFPGESGSDKYKQPGGGILYQAGDGFAVILTDEHLTKYWTGKKWLVQSADGPVRVTQPQQENGFTSDCAQRGRPGAEWYQWVQGPGDIMAMVIQTHKDLALEPLKLAEAEAGTTVYGLSKPEGNVLRTLLPTKVTVPEDFDQKDGTVKIPGKGFAVLSSGYPVFSDGLIGLVFRQVDDEGKEILVTTVKDKIEQMKEGIEAAKKELIRNFGE